MNKILKPSFAGSAEVYQGDNRIFGSKGLIPIGICTTFYLGKQEYGITVTHANVSGVEDQLEAWARGYLHEFAPIFR